MPLTAGFVLVAASVIVAMPADISMVIRPETVVDIPAIETVATAVPLYLTLSAGNAPAPDELPPPPQEARRKVAPITNAPMMARVVRGLIWGLA